MKNYDKIKQWVKTNDFVSTSKIQRTFSLGFISASKIIESLIEERCIESVQTKRGYKVLKKFGINDMHITFVDYNEQIVSIFTKKFSKLKNITIVNDDIESYFKTNKECIDCLVSPANSYGKMTGGYDQGLSDALGWDFQLKVQKYIKLNYEGEQPVGSAFIIDTGINGIKLIHCPTMQKPSIIKDDFIIYTCTRSTLLCALKNNIINIVMPVFGTETGGVKPNKAADMMYEAIMQLSKHDEKYKN